MHELSITQDLVDLVVAEAAGRPVRRVALRVGRLSGIDPDAVRFCFGPCSAGTVAAAAALTIEWVPGHGRCCHCGATFAMDDYVGLCPHCDRARIEVTGGNDFILTALEVETCV